MLLNAAKCLQNAARVSALTISELLRENEQGVTLPPPNPERFAYLNSTRCRHIL